MRTDPFRGVGIFAVLLVLFAAPAMAQSIVEGRVVDAQGNPVEGATVVFEATGTASRITTTTDGSGGFFQLGLPSGEYNIQVSKEGVGSQSQTVTVQQRRNPPVQFTLTPARVPAAGEAPPNPEAAAIQAAAASAMQAMQAGQYQTAIAQFNELVVKVPTCAECYYSLGTAYTNTKQLAEAEAAFKKVLELQPESADAYTGLANIYNSQKRFDEAAAASAKAAELSSSAGGAAGGGNASAIYNQGVIFWNAGKFAEAKEQFEAATKADPNMAMAFYQLGMANLNTGDVPGARAAFQRYLELEPDGPKAPEVKVFVDQLPQ